MLLGMYEGRLDSQGRLVIPQRLRSGIEAGMVIARGLDGNLDVYPAEGWNGRVARLPDPESKDGRLVRRQILASAFNAQLDGQGRIAIPLQSRQQADITLEVVIAGQDDHFEVWSPARWQQQLAQAENLDEVQERVRKERD